MHSGLVEHGLRFRRYYNARLNACLNLATVVVLTAMVATPVSAQTEQNFLVEFTDDKLSIRANN